MSVTREEFDALEGRVAVIEAELSIKPPVEPPEPPPVEPPPSGDLGNAMMPPNFPDTVPAGETLTIGPGEHIAGLIVNSGVVVIEDGASLTCRGIYNKKGGTLIMGTPTAPAANINVYMTGELDLVGDPWQWFPGIVNAGHWIANGTPVGLDGEVYPDQKLTQIPFRRDSDFRRYNSTTRDPDAWSITTDWGQTIRAGDCNLTRGLTIRGGHIAHVHSGTRQFRNVCAKGVGRTTIQDLDDTGYIDGVLHVGTNQRGRYSLHDHHVMDGSKSSMTDCVVWGGSKWGVVTHDSPNSVVEDTLVFDVAGAGFMREGIKAGGQAWRRNIAFGITGDMDKVTLNAFDRGGAFQYKMPNGEMVIDGGRAGDGFWTDNALGIDIEDCTAIGCRHAGFQENGYWQKGAHSTGAHNRNRLWSQACWIAYWASWDQTVKADYVPRYVEIGSRDCANGIEAWHNGRITFFGDHRGDPAVAKLSEGGKGHRRKTFGAFFVNYEAGGHRVMGDVTGFNIGVGLPTNNDAHVNKQHLPTKISGTFSNDIDIWGSDTRAITVTHEATIDSIDDFRPGCPNVEPAMLTLIPREEGHRADTAVLLNGQLHVLTADSGPVVVN